MFKNTEEIPRDLWLRKTLMALPAGLSILDAGAGQLRNRVHCSHLKYTSQDFCQYSGQAGGSPDIGLQNEKWDTSRIDIVSDIAHIPVPDGSFDCVLCSEVLEHIPNPQDAIREFARIVRPGGKLIVTAPFASNVHMAPYYFTTGFSRFWYEHHLSANNFSIDELTANGDWHALLLQEISRLGGIERRDHNWAWPFAYFFAILGHLYFRLRSGKPSGDLACFGFHCVATRLNQ